jgi:AraC family cel operon transcriptional repressor
MAKAKRERITWVENPVLSIEDKQYAVRLTDYYDQYVHSHDFFEIVYILTGEITHELEGKTVEMKTGDAFLVIPGVKHRFRRHGECVHRDLLVSKELYKSICDYVDENLYERLCALKYVPFRVSSTQMAYFENTILDFNNLPPNTQGNYQKILAFQTLGLLYGNTAQESADTFKGKCITIVNENLSKPNTLDILRQELGYTDVYFCKKFKATFGVTPTTFVNEKRIKVAAYTLSISTLTIEEICYSVGFESIPYFIKLFKKQYGVTPAKYRKMQHGEKQKIE